MSNSPVNIQRELLFLHMTLDDKLVFHDVTAEAGKPSRYRKKVHALLGVRISDKVVAFHSRHVTKNAASRLLGEPLAVPRRSFERMEAKAVALSETLTPGKLVARINDQELEFTIKHENGIVSLAPAFEDEPFELPRKPLQISFFFKSPVVDRIIAVQFTGYLNRKIGDTETATRAVSLVINSLIGLREFSQLSQIIDIETPRAPEAAPVAPKRSKSDYIRFPITAHFYDSGKEEHLKSVDLLFEVDLDHVNQSDNTLLYRVLPNAEIEKELEVYKKVLLDAVSKTVLGYLPADEQSGIILEIILGELADGSRERIKDAVEGLPDIDVTPERWEWTEA